MSSHEKAGARAVHVQGPRECHGAEEVAKFGHTLP